MRVESEKEIDCKEAGTGYLHRLTDAPRKRPTPVYTATIESERASPGFCHTIYTQILNNLTLSSAHRDHLRDRGLDDDVISALGYKTMPDGTNKRDAFVSLEKGYGDVLLGVPGFYLTKNKHIWLAGSPGIIIPCKNVDGKIIGAQIRVDDTSKGGKYKWLSASVGQRRRGGVGSGAPIHVAKAAGSYRVDRLWITEGILKADLAALKLGETASRRVGV